MDTHISALERSLNKFCTGLGMSVGLVVALITALIVYGVIAREVLGFSDTWVTEVTTYLMGYIAFVGAGYVLWGGRHVRVEVLAAHVGRSGQTILFVFTNTILSLVAVLLVFLSSNFCIDAWRDGEKSWGTFSIPLWIPYAMFVAGTVIFLCLHIARTFIDWQKLRHQHRSRERSYGAALSEHNILVKE